MKSPYIYIAIIGLLLSSEALVAQDRGNSGSDKKVTICHHPPGNPENAQTIVVSKNAADAHMRNHGDYYGPCRKDTVPPPPSDSVCYCDLDGDGMNDMEHGYTESKLGVTAHFTSDGKTIHVSATSNITSAVLTLGDSSQITLAGNGTGTDTFGIEPSSFQMIAYIEVRTEAKPGGVILENAPFTDPYDACECLGPPPFPVKLTSFKAERLDENTVKLLWSTAGEENNDYFLIEKTYGFDDWEEVCKVPGHGTTQVPHDYNCLDENANEGGNNTVYYRPKQVDFNGAYEYFNVIKIRLQDIASSYEVKEVYPNPADDRLFIKYNSTENSQFDISILTLDGKLLMANSYIARPGDQVFNLDLEENHLKPGFYILQVQSGDEVFRQKVYKQ